MKNLQTVITAVAAEYHVSPTDITDSIRAYFEHLMEDPAFREAWEQIPKEDGIPDEQYLLALMIANAG